MFDLLISNAHAQAAGAQANPIMNFVPIILVFVVFYFLMIKPQKKKMQQEQKFVAEVQKGDEVFTKSGMIGTIYGLTDKVVTLDVDNGTKIKFLRTQIAGSAKSLYETKEEKTKK